MRRIRVSKRRRKENKTNYSKRFRFLKSGSPRLVFRKTNGYLVAQYVVSNESQDKVDLGMSSKELKNYGWPGGSEGSLKSLPASYLLGYLAGKKITSKGLETPIIDFGMIRMVKKSRPFGFLKGLVDSGVEINYKEESLPEESRIKGEHLKNKVPFEKIKSEIEKV